MTTNDTMMLWAMVALVALALVIVVVALIRRRARARSAALEEQFGPEYERTVEELGDRSHAERELVARAERAREFPLHELSMADRMRFEASWSRIQAQFVDDPAVAVVGADQLIVELMRARGYPSQDFEQRVADLSVAYPDVVQHYRAAHTLSASARTGQPDTEDLRQAVVHYRVLFAELLQDAETPVPLWRHAHAHAQAH